MLILNIRSKSLRCIIIFMKIIFVCFPCMKILLQRKSELWYYVPVIGLHLVGYPIWLQTTSVKVATAVVINRDMLQTSPQLPSRHNSTWPSLSVLPPTSLTSPSVVQDSVWEGIQTCALTNKWGRRKFLYECLKPTTLTSYWWSRALHSNYWSWSPLQSILWVVRSQCTFLKEW